MSNIISIANNKQEQLYFLVHSGSIEFLSQFLLAYMDEIDLSKFDKNGLNVWHYVSKLGNVRMLRLLMNVTPKSEWKKYLNTAAQTADKPLCFHLAVEEKQVEMVKEFRRICETVKNDDEESKSGGEESILDINCLNGKKQTPMKLCLEKSFYYGMKALFDPTADNSENITRMLRLVCYSEEEYDKETPTECKNYKLFKLLLTQNGVKGDEIVSSSLNRVDYFKYLFEVNDKLNTPFDNDRVWYWLGCYPDPKSVKFMLSTSKPGFEFTSHIL